MKELKKKSVTEKSITVSWKKLKNVDGYQIRCYDGDGKLVKSVKTTETKERFEELEKGTYTFKVRAYKSTDSYTTYGTMSDAIEVSIE